MKNKVVLITGASSGIGRALAFEFGKHGAKLAIAARNPVHLEETVLALKNQHIDVIATVADVSLEADCKRFVDEAVAQYGQIDVLINNAGISMRALFKDLDLKVIRQLMDINFWGTVYCTKYALPYLLQTQGSVVGIVSIAGHIGLPARSGYSASKFAMRGFLDTLRIENLKTGLHVMVVAPGFTSSNIRKSALRFDGSQQNETPRDESKMMPPETVAKKIYRGVVKRKRSQIFTFVEGKLAVFLSKWMPALLDRLDYKHMAKEPDSPFK